VPLRSICMSLTLASLASFSGCGENLPKPEQTADVRIEKLVGIHQLNFIVPQGWQHLDQGASQAFRNAGALLELHDLGTFSRLDIIDHIKAAQELYANGEPLAAQEHVKRLPYIQAAFLKAEDWLRVEDSWRTLTERQERDRPRDVKSAYEQVLNSLYQQPKTDLSLVAEKLLQIEDRNGQREVSQENALSIDGRKAVLIDTWDRLSHSMKKQHLFVLNEGNILALTVRLGPYDSVAQPFNEIARSLTFATAAP